MKLLPCRDRGAVFANLAFERAEVHDVCDGEPVPLVLPPIGSIQTSVMHVIQQIAVAGPDEREEVFR